MFVEACHDLWRWHSKSDFLLAHVYARTCCVEAGRWAAWRWELSDFAVWFSVSRRTFRSLFSSQEDFSWNGGAKFACGLLWSHLVRARSRPVQASTASSSHAPGAAAEVFRWFSFQLVPVTSRFIVFFALFPVRKSAKLGPHLVGTECGLYSVHAGSL